MQSNVINSSEEYASVYASVLGGGWEQEDGEGGQCPAVSHSGLCSLLAITHLTHL